MVDEQLNSVLTEVLDVYKTLGIQELAEYQREILQNHEFYPPHSRNLLLSSPTGSGKNLVADILAIVNARLTNKKCIFISPYVSASQEVFFNLQQVWREFGLNIKPHFGAVSTSPNDEFDAIVCTIEKSSAFINRLLREDTLSEYCSIIIDEIHMVIDSDRGGHLEDLIVKLNYCKAAGREVPQLIAMSATLECPQQISQFIDANFVEYTERLNQLEEFGVAEKRFYSVGGHEAIGELDPSFNIVSDKNAVIGLTIEALIQNKSVLIFCMTKACAEESANLIAKYVCFCNSKPQSRFPQLQKLGVFNESGLEFPDKIKRLLKAGVAYHHSGLSNNDRFTIEKLYRQGQIKVISCTSTLSTGVNLPAARILIRLDQGPMNINFISYNQMIGRCGRVGYEAGQAFVIAQNAQKLESVWKLIQKRPFNRVERDFTQLLLDAVVSKLVKTEEDCENLLKLAIQRPSISSKDIVSYLIEQKFVYIYVSKDGETILVPNQLSIAASQSFLRPNDALYICMELERAAKNICLDVELHLAYLVTPLKHKMGIDIGKISWHKFFNLFDKLPSEFLRVANLVGVDQNACVDALNGAPKVALVRFYLALILMEALQGVPVQQILQKYDFKMADLEVLRDQAVLYARTVTGMCECLAWPYLKNVLNLFSKKLELWAYPEVCDLMKLKGMDGTRARSFIERGITTAQELAIANLSTVERILRHAVPFLIDANNNGDRNEWLLNEQIESCAEAAQLIIERAQLLAPIQQSFLAPNNKSASSGHSVYNSTRQSFSESLNESAVNQLEQNIDATMNSITEMTAELSMIECENDENRSPNEGSRCVNEFVETCNYAVFELIGDQFFLMSSDEASTLNIPLNPNKKCSRGCCSATKMLETFIFCKNIQKYAHNLSLIFYKASGLLNTNGIRNLMNIENMTNFYCILTLFRVRFKKCPHTSELLDAEIKKWSNSFLTKEEQTNKHAIVGLCRFVSQVLLKSNANLKSFNKFGQHFNDSVLTSVLMSCRGFAFDQLQYQKLIKYIMKEIVLVERSAWNLAGEQFNMHNGRATRQMLDKLGVPSTGKPTITIGELEQTKHPIASLIIRARRLSHANKVLRGIQAMVSSDNRIRPHYNCLSSCTGRIFAEDPQIQFVPKEKYLDGQSCRSVFCASPGCVLLAFDFKQVELRMLAALSEDKKLCELLKNDMDPFEHIVTSWPLERDHKKKIFYALLYGMQKKSLAQELKCTIDEAEKVISEIFQYFHGVRSWIEDVAASASQNGFAQSAWNLSISMQNLTDFEVRQKAPHFIIQASVSEIIRKLMNDVERKFQGHLVLQMHDEFIVEAHENQAETCAHLIKELMEFELNGINFPVKVRRGPNWCALE